MKVLKNWMAEFTPLGEVDPDELGDVLSDLGLAVEEQVAVGADLDGVVVAEVLDLRPHPDADRIQLVDVDAGDGEALQICCGAFNMAVGDRVPLATLGTTMRNGMTIERRKMRGEWSNGMLCAPDELGFGADHSGIWLLSGEGLDLGRSLSDVLGLTGDVLYDLEVNPNRPDAMSVAGVARDVAARLGLEFALPAPQPVRSPDGDASDLVTVEIVDGDLCGRFQARILRGIRRGPSAPSVAARLTLLGMRPLGNVVDVSNYVMLELGQPNHPYDLAKVAGSGFRIRRAVEGETITTLDDVERTCTDETLLICDGTDAPIGIAGIMGGASSEIDETTTDVVVEMAWFQPMNIARSSRRLGLRSEASARFEKGGDWDVIDLAMDRFAELLAPDGAVLVDGSVDAHGELPSRQPISVRTERVNAVLGTQLTGEQIRSYLEPIGFSPAPDGDDTTVTIPSFRLDSSSEIDVVEEVARIHGYSAIATRVPPSVHVGALTPRQLWRRELRRSLVALGASEAMPLPFLAPGDLARCGLGDDGISILNPLVAEESVLRTSLLPGLLKAVVHNDRHREPEVALWEIGRVQRHPAVADAVLPDEPEVLGLVLAGRDATAAIGAWQALCEDHGIRSRVVNDEIPALHPTRAARLEVAGRVLGAAGEVDPGVLEAHGLTQRVAWLEVDLDALWDAGFGQRTYRKVSRYPSADVDLAFEVAEEVPAGDVERTLRSAHDLVTDVALFDVFRGEQVADGQRSLAYRLRFQAPDRTLTDDELSSVRHACIEAVVAGHGAVLRG